MKTPWALLVGMSVLFTMWIISTGAVLLGDGDAFNKALWPFVSGFGVWLSVRALMRDAIAMETRRAEEK